MPDDLTLRPLGRVSEPSHNVAPAGSMLVAKNVVIREQGVVSPVPDLSADISTGGVNGGPYNMSPVFTNGATNEQLLVIVDGAGVTVSAAKTSVMGTPIQFTDPDGDAANIGYPLDGNSYPIRLPMYLERDNLYVCDKRGLFKWETTAEANLEPLWDIEPPIGIFSGATTTGWLANNDHVLYRTVIRFRDSNGVIRRTRPSARFQYDNTTGVTRNPALTLNFETNQQGMFSTIESVELYRTKALANTIALPNEYYLTADVPIGDFTSGVSSSIVDTNSDTDIVRFLYTNSSREGLTGSNFAPPECLTHASFKGSQFWGNVAELEVTEALDITDTTGPTFYSRTGDYVSGTPDVTNISDMTGLEVGQIFRDITHFPGTPTTYIVSLDVPGSSAVVSANATSSDTTQSFRADDAIYVLHGDGEADRVSVLSVLSSGTVRGQGFGARSSVVDLIHTSDSSRSLGDNWPNPISYTLATTRRTARSGGAQFWVNKLSMYANSDLADLSSDGAPTSGGTKYGPALHKSRIYWSKLDEPEHTTTLSFQDIGDTGADDEIVAMASTKDSLFIFKTDGIFRLSGISAVNGWRVDPFDTSVRIIGRETVRVMDNAIYALSDQGIIKVTEAGVERLSDSIVGDWIADRTVAAYDYRAQYGEFPPFLMAVANQATREYVLHGNTSVTAASSTESLVYNAKTQAWYTWDHAYSTGDEFPTYLSYSPLGDYTSAASAGLNQPSIIFGLDSTGAAHVFRMAAVSGTDEAIDVQFRVKTGGDPTHLKLWKDAVFDCKRDSGASGTVSAQFVAADEDTAVTLVTVADADGTEIRMWVPQEQARNGKLLVGIKGTGLTLYGLRLTFASSGREAPLE